MQHLASVFRWFLDGNQNSENFKKLSETLTFHWLIAIKKRLVESHVLHALCVLLAGRQIGQGGLDRQLQELQDCPVFCALGLRPGPVAFLIPWPKYARCYGLGSPKMLRSSRQAESAWPASSLVTKALAQHPVWCWVNVSNHRKWLCKELCCLCCWTCFPLSAWPINGLGFIRSWPGWHGDGHGANAFGG